MKIKITKKNKILFIVTIILFIILFLYINAINKMTINYSQEYDRCEISNSRPNFDNEFKSKQKSSCLESNGCYQLCGSGCGLAKRPSLNPLIIFDYYITNERTSIFSSGACTSHCVQGCLLPLKD